MAIAEIKTEKVPVTTFEDKETVVLKLDRAEAEALIALVGSCVAGGRMSPIFEALADLGIEGDDYSVDINGCGVITVSSGK